MNKLISNNKFSMRSYFNEFSLATSIVETNALEVLLRSDSFYTFRQCPALLVDDAHVGAGS